MLQLFQMESAFVLVGETVHPIGQGPVQHIRIDTFCRWGTVTLISSYHAVVTRRVFPLFLKVFEEYAFNEFCAS